MKKEATKPKPEEKKETPAEQQHTPEEKKEIQVIERIFEAKEIAPSDAFGKLNRQQVDLIKRTVAKGASDDELKLFIQVCKGANLNPFLRQAHLVPFWDSKEGVERRAIIVGIDGFRAVAESSGQYAGNDDPIFEGENEMSFTGYDKKQNKLTVPGKATVSVYKVVEGQRYPFTATARWTEYYPGEKKGGQWHKMPYLMLGKCAEALALRKAFPKLLSGMYAAEEMDQAQPDNAPIQRQQKGFEILISAIDKASKKELEDYKAKMEKSDKYTDAQKKEYSQKVDARLAELAKPEPTEQKAE